MEKADLERILREMKMLSELDNEHIIKVFQIVILNKIKTIISLMKEPDKELTSSFGDNYKNFKLVSII